MLFLPRQARDKHRENSKKRPISCSITGGGDDEDDSNGDDGNQAAQGAATQTGEEQLMGSRKP